MNRATFRTLHPEFDGVSDATLDAELARALGELSALAWDTLLDDGQRWLTAHNLALSPYGINARLVDKSGGTTYGTKFKALERRIARGPKVI